jgi:ABC-type transport system involved in cytochrome bd biosynthesis fused ATPase/permease subunit
MPLDTAMLAILLAPEAFWPIRRVGTEFHSAADGAAALNDFLAEIEHAPTPRNNAEHTDIEHTDPAQTDTAQTDTVQTGPGLDAANALMPAPRVNDETGVGPSPVVGRGVRYSFPGARTQVLQDMSFTLPIGLTVVTGPSGVGKSTLLELLAGLRRPSAGTLTAPRAHLVSQRPFLAPGTVRDNLSLGNNCKDDELWQILRKVGLDYLVITLPDGLDTRLGDDGFGLSAGQRARLTLARAALSSAPLLLLDEPTAHLDEESADLAHQLIQKLARLRTVVAVTHRPELLSLADEHLHLTGRPAEGLAVVLS